MLFGKKIVTDTKNGNSDIAGGRVKFVQGQASAAHSLKDTIESLVIAFVLAFVFRAFVIEAFVIPTGSMADTLRGAHFRLVCQNCGHQYNYGYVPGHYGYKTNKLPGNPINVVQSRVRHIDVLCPYCGSLIDNSIQRNVCNGDRILVLKYIYQFKQPDIWDVVVFKNPAPDGQNGVDPLIQDNYIKRMIGRPGETVEIIDGDVYINNVIQPRPENVQDVMWIPIFDQNYQPPAERSVNGWDKPFLPAQEENTAWREDDITKRYYFDGSDSTDIMTFQQGRLKVLVSNFISYNGWQSFNRRTQDITSDLKISASCQPTEDQGKLYFYMSKYGRTYRASIDFSGKCEIFDEYNDKVICSQDIKPLKAGQQRMVSFAIVNHQFILQVGEGPERDLIVYDGPNDAADWGYRGQDQNSYPTVSLAGSGGKFELENIKLFRDTHYTVTPGGFGSPGLATEGHPITLGDEEYFVLGDNSAASSDSRFWGGMGYDRQRQPVYTTGTVPEEYLIGKAFFVYWPAGHKLPFGNLNLVPDVGRMRFIR